MKKFIGFLILFSLILFVPMSSQTTSFYASTSSRPIPAGWWGNNSIYLHGPVDASIEGIDVVITYPPLLSHSYGEYVATWGLPSSWWYTGPYLSPTSDTLHFALMGTSQFSFGQTLFVGQFPFYVSNAISQGQTVRLGISVSIFQKVQGGRDTLIHIPYVGGYITGGPNVLAGDADGDGQYSMLDAFRILEISTGQYTASLMDSLRSAVSGDGSITSYCAYEVFERTVYPWYTFEVLQGENSGGSGGKGVAVQIPTPVVVQLTEINDGVLVSLPSGVSIHCGDFNVSSAMNIDKNLNDNGIFRMSSDAKRLSFFASKTSISGNIGFIPNVRADDLKFTGTVDNGNRIITKIESTTGVNTNNETPKIFSLSQNYPNPFNPSTKISFSLPQSVKVTLKIYDVLGREVTTLIDGMMNAGNHDAMFNASKFSSGTFICRLNAGSFVETKKMVLLK